MRDSILLSIDNIHLIMYTFYNQAGTDYMIGKYFQMQEQIQYRKYHK